MSPLLLTIDIGTTAIKFNLYNEKEVIYSMSERIDTKNEGLKSTQNPEAILNKIKSVIKIMTKKFSNIEQISLSTAMHSLISQKKGEPDTMYLWSDNRGADVVKTFKQNKSLATLFYKKTGTPIHGMSPFAKLLYFKEKKPHVYSKIEKWLDIKSYIVYALTKQCMVDYSVASATGLFNSEKLDWDEDILRFLSLDQLKLPLVVPPKTNVKISKAVCEELGFTSQINLMVGASDGCLISLASFNQTKSKISLTLGTSGAVRIISKSRQLSKNHSLFCYYLDDNTWVIGGPTNNGGVIIEWLSQLFFDNKEQLFKALGTLKKTDNLLFYPYLQGERAPFWDENKTGSFLGLTISQGRDELIQAVLEGIMFNLKIMFEQLPVDEKDEQLILSGGVFKNHQLAQMLATILNQTCLVTNQSEPGQCLKDWWHKSKHTNVLFETFYPKKAELDYYEKKYQLFIERMEKI